MASKLCDSCKSATAALFCRADTAFLCPSCDSKIHAANKLASRHARVVICEVCEQAPAHVTCKADAASLCVTCDRDIHAANPVAQKHERVPIVPFYDSAPSALTFRALLDGDDDVSREEEEEAASWLLPNPKLVADDVNTGQFLFGDVDPYLDVDYGSSENPKFDPQIQVDSPGSDGVVPIRTDAVRSKYAAENGFDLDLNGVAKSYSFSHSLSSSSSSLEVGLVPEGSTVTDISNTYGLDPSSRPTQLSPVDREARVLRYREKRKNRKFEKTIRYASRKAYAETRPRIKGRFAKRTELVEEADTDRIFRFGVVPSSF